MGSSGVDFARQVREHNASLNPAINKKLRSSAAPKGTKLAAGYQDRTQLRTSAEEDEKATRIKSLEEMVKLGQMDEATFQGLRDEIVGGDVKDVHLVKGLDWKLLERVKKGEDVLSSSPIADDPSTGERMEEDVADVDDALRQFEEKEIKPVVKEDKVKKGEMAPPPLSLAGRKRNRDEILRELKASRQAKADAEKPQPSLGPKFRKLGEKRETSRIERDEKGREVLITVDEEGKVKRKIRKAESGKNFTQGNGLLMPDKNLEPLGMEVPEIAPAKTQMEDEDIDIFEGIGVDYNPLGGLNDETDDSSDDDAAQEDAGVGKDEAGSTANNEDRLPPSHSTSNNLPLNGSRGQTPEKSTTVLRNYFGETEAGDHEDFTNQSNPLKDPTILAALKKASTINPSSSTGSEPSNDEEVAKLVRRKKMLESHDRDAEDMDMGFGSSRFEDEEGGGDKQIKLSTWGKDEGDEGGKGDGKAKRKRGPKKRKGDGNNAADVLKVMERRKGEAK